MVNRPFYPQLQTLVVLCEGTTLQIESNLPTSYETTPFSYPNLWTLSQYPNHLSNIPPGFLPVFSIQPP